RNRSIRTPACGYSRAELGGSRMQVSSRQELAWTDVEPYFDLALQLDAQSCATWLHELDERRPEVARAVRGLLAQREALNGAGFPEGSAFAGVESRAPALRDSVARHAARLTGPAAAGAQPQPGWEAGTLVGPYRLIREVGVGGMSSVWLAERSDGQLKREIAL